MNKHSDKLAIFDLDETLIHSLTDDEIAENEKYDVKLKYKFEDEEEHLYVNIRPNIREGVNIVKQYYQVVLFTASTQDYADTILNHIDPNRNLFPVRLYRKSGLETEDDVYIKDLRIFENQWKLKDIVLIDNSAHSFGLQGNNGIPILSYYKGSNDKELIQTARLLQNLFFKTDVRPSLKSMFGIQKLKRKEICETVYEEIIKYEHSQHSSTKLEKSDSQGIFNVDADAQGIPVFTSKRNTIKDLNEVFPN